MYRSSVQIPKGDAEDETVTPVDPTSLSLARLVRAGIAIAAIVVLGGLFWTALGAFLAAWGSVAASLPNAAAGAADHTEHFLGPAPASFSPAEPVRITPTSLATVTPPQIVPVPLATETVPPTPLPTLSPTPQPDPPGTPTPAPTVEAAAEGTPASGDRAPWVLLPQPAPGARVASGPLQLEARGRGDAPISDIRLELDGRALPVAVEQRSDVIWRGVASAQVGSGRHSVKALVVDAQGRTGSYGWTFEAGN